MVIFEVLEQQDNSSMAYSAGFRATLAEAEQLAQERRGRPRRYPAATRVDELSFDLTAGDVCRMLAAGSDPETAMAAYPESTRRRTVREFES